MYLYGASGRGKVIKEILESQGRKVDGFVDDNPEVTELAGLPVQHTMNGVDEVIVSIGVNQTRKKVVEKIHAKIAKPAIHEKAVVSSSAQIGEGTLVGVGASVIPCQHIGQWAVIGAGAAVVSDIPDGVVAVGVPAKVK